MIKKKILLRPKVKALLVVLEQGGIWTVDNLARELLIDRKKLRLLVASLRRKFMAGHDVPYIFTTGTGYTIEEKPEHIAFESRMRLRQGYGILLNGIYVFKRYKQLSPKAWDNLYVSFKPRVLPINKLLIKWGH